MTVTNTLCPTHPWPLRECLHALPVVRPAADTTGLVLSDADSDQIARLAEATVVAAFAVAGGIVALAVGVLRNLLSGQR